MIANTYNSGRYAPDCALIKNRANIQMDIKALYIRWRQTGSRHIHVANR